MSSPPPFPPGTGSTSSPATEANARFDRIIVFAKALSSLARWCRGDGQRLVHIHTAVRGSIYRKSLCVASSGPGRPSGGASAARGRRRHRRLCGPARPGSAGPARRGHAAGRCRDQRLTRGGAPHRGELRRQGRPRRAEPRSRRAARQRARKRQRRTATAVTLRRSFSAASRTRPRAGTCCCAHSPRSSRGIRTCA